MAYNNGGNKRSRQERVQEATDQMQTAIDQYFTSPDQLKEYLSFMGKFYNYSPRNTALIRNQFHGAEAVGSFKFWKDQGYSVQKGEKGIKILTPQKSAHKFKNSENQWKNIKNASETEKQQIQEGTLEQRKPKTYFSIGHVFDVSQTDATEKDLPEIFPNKWLDGEVQNYEQMMDSLKDIASNMGVSIGSPFEELGSAKGAFYYDLNGNSRGHIGLNPRNGELQNVKTMVHELAHAELHHSNEGATLSDAEKEFQAELVAFTVNDYFNIDTSDYSLQYLYNWTKNSDIKNKMQLVDEVQQTSVKFIEKVENDLMLDKELNVEFAYDDKNRNYTLISYGKMGQSSVNYYNEQEIKTDLLNDGSLNIDEFNKLYAEKYTLFNNESIKEPQVVFKWSESDLFDSNQFMTYGKASELTSELATENKGALGYDKTWYSIVLPNENGEIAVIPMDRLDIGDNEFSGIHEQVSEVRGKQISEQQWKSLNQAYLEHNKEPTINNKDSDGLYWYELKKRPMSIGTQPKGIEQFDEDKGEWGIIAYSKPLSDKDMDDFELSPYEPENKLQQDDMESGKEKNNQSVKQHEMEM